jgi:hypothetical protein
MSACHLRLTPSRTTINASVAGVLCCCHASLQGLLELTTPPKPKPPFASLQGAGASMNPNASQLGCNRLVWGVGAFTWVWCKCSLLPALARVATCGINTLVTQLRLRPRKKHFCTPHAQKLDQRAICEVSRLPSCLLYMQRRSSSDREDC